MSCKASTLRQYFKMLKFIKDPSKTPPSLSPEKVNQIFNNCKDQLFSQRSVVLETYNDIRLIKKLVDNKQWVGEAIMHKEKSKGKLAGALKSAAKERVNKLTAKFFNF